MKQLFLIIAGLLIVYLSSCGDLALDDRPDRRREDPYGKVELPEEIMDEDFFDFTNCKPPVDTPDNAIDMILGVIPAVSKNNPLMISRRCLKDKLDKAHNNICDSRYTLEKQREEARDNATINRIENQIYRLDQIQWRFNQKMQELANKFDKYRNQAVDERESADAWLGAVLWVGEQEAIAYSNIFDIESYNECYSRIDDDSRYNRRNRDRDRIDRDRIRRNGRRRI